MIALRFSVILNCESCVDDEEKNSKCSETVAGFSSGRVDSVLFFTRFLRKRAGQSTVSDWKHALFFVSFLFRLVGF